MKAHVIENGVIVNTIVVDSLENRPDLVSAESGGNIGEMVIEPEATAEGGGPTQETAGNCAKGAKNGEKQEDMF